MITVPIHQASLSAPPVSTPIIDLTPSKLVSPPIQEPIFTATTATTTITTLPLPPPPQQQSTTDPELASRVSTQEKISLDISIDRENMEEFNEEMAKSRKRHRDDQDPSPPPPKDSDRKKLPQAPPSKKFASPSEQPIDDVPIPEDMHLSDSEDTEEEAPETPEPDWVIPLKDLPETENNWTDALAKTYKDPEENKLLRKTRDMGSFINWYCKQIGKSKLVKADLEGPTYKLVKPFHKNNISHQFQMEECHLLLTDQIDLLNPEGNRVMHDISKPLPLGGLPGQVTIQTQYFFNKDLEYLVSGDKERRNALSISKLKAAYYPEFRLEELV
ncbi:hypothetical protein Tco_1365497 [Tanacetum coccineum]